MVDIVDWTLGPFIREDTANPCLTPDPTATFFCPIREAAVHWEEKDVFNPAAVVRDGQIHLLYRAEDTEGRFAGTSRIGLATSTDGLHFVRRPTPVLYPDHDEMEIYEWEGGCEDPRIVEDGLGGYILTYTAYDGHTARLAVASSTDLVHWQKHGLAFGNAQAGRYRDLWSKSGAIVCSLDGDHLVATRIQGKYWMYWGESDIYLATSDNLVDWEPLLIDRWTELLRMIFGALEPEQRDDALGMLQQLIQSHPVQMQGRTPAALHQALLAGQDTPWRSTVLGILDTFTAGAATPGHDDFRPIFGPRQGRFDSSLVEPGPPALLTGQGILLIYNSKNRNPGGAENLPDGTYAAGQVLCDPQDPAAILRRVEAPFFWPERPYEITGQVGNVCFLEGLAPYQGRWYLYYGTADSKIAVATGVM